MSNLVDDIVALRAEGKTYSEIATILGCSKSTVSYHIGEGQKAKTKARRNKSKPHPLQKKLWDYRKNSDDDFIPLKDVLDKFGPEPRCYLTGVLIDLNKPETYSLDHKTARSKGGRSDLENMGLASRDANQAKHAMSLDDFYELCRRVIENVPKEEVQF